MRIIEISVIKPHPVVVVKNLCPAQRLDKFFLIVEIKWENFYLSDKSIAAVKRIGKSPHSISGGEQTIRYILARKTKCSGYNMYFIRSHVPSCVKCLSRLFSGIGQNSSFSSLRGS